MTFEEQSGIGDPTNPNAGSRKPKAQQTTFEQESGINLLKAPDYQTNHDAGQVNGDVNKYQPEIRNAGTNQDEVMAANQPLGDKAVRSLTKAAGLAGGLVVGTFGSLPFGVGATVANIQNKKQNGQELDLQDFKPLVDNPINDKIQEFNDYLEKDNTLYASQEEKDSAALSSKNIFTSNFLFDKIIKNAGFTVGAIGSGKIVGAMLGNASKLIAAGAYGAERVAEVESLLAQGIKLPQALEKVAQTLRVGQHFSNLGAVGVMAAGEAQFEGADATRSMREKLQQDLAQSTNREVKDLLPFELEDIEKRATASGVVTAAVNLPILALSDFIQFGNSLTKGFKTEASAFSNRVANRIERGLGASAFEKTASRVKAFGSGIVTEGFEEGAQTFTQKSTEDYYSRKFDLDAKDGIDDILHSVVYGAGQLLGSKEGLESMLLGAITGLGSHIVMGGVKDNLNQWNAVKNDYDSEKEGSTANLLKRMKEHADESGLTAKVEGAVRGQSIQEAMNYAVETGNNYDFQSLKHDRWKNMVQTYTEAGKLDKLYSMLDGLKGLDKADFLEQFPEADLENKSISQIVEARKQEAKKLSQIWDNVQTRFPLSSKAERTQIWSNLADAENRLKREKELDAKITGLGTTSSVDGRLIMPFASLVQKHGVITEGAPTADSQEILKKAREEYKQQALAYLESNSSAEFDEKDVDEMFKLQEDRATLVGKYQQMKEGKSFVSPNSTIPPTEEVVEDKEGEVVNSTEPGATNEVIPSTSKAGTTTKTTTKNNTGLSDLATSYLKVLRKIAKSGKRASQAGLTEEEMNLNLMTSSADPAEQAAVGEAKALLLDHTTKGTLDQLDTLLEGGTVEGGEEGNEEETQEQKDKRSKDELNKAFTTLYDKLWGVHTKTHRTGVRQYFNKDEFKKGTSKGTVKAFLNDIVLDLEELRKLTEGKEEFAKRMENLEEKLVILNNFVADIQSPTPITPSTSTNEGVVNPNKPVKLISRHAGEYMPHTKKTYESLGKNVTGQPLTLNGVVLTDGAEVTVVYNKSATEVYDKGDKKGKPKEQFNVRLGNIDLGYLSDIDLNEGAYPADLLALNKEILRQARENGTVTVKIKVNYGLNNVSPTAKRSPLSASVFAKSNQSIKIYKIEKGEMLDMSDSKKNQLPEDASNYINDNGSYAYVMLVKSPDGQTRTIGLNGLPTTKKGDFQELANLINSKGKDARTAIRSKFWLASSQKNKEVAKFSTTFVKLSDKRIGIAVSNNRRLVDSDAAESFGVTTDAKNFGILTFKEGASFTNQQEFIDSLEVSPKDWYFIQQATGATSIADLFSESPVKNEITPGSASLKDYQLSVDPNQPWLPSIQVTEIVNSGKLSKINKAKRGAKVEDTTVENTSPIETAEENDRVPFGINEDIPDLGEFDALEAAENEKNAREAEVSPDKAFKLATGADRVTLNMKSIERSLSKILPKNIGLAGLKELANGIYVNNETIGAFFENMIYLNDMVEKGAEYHEAFHAIFRTVFTSEQRGYLFNLVEGKVDTSDLAIRDFIKSNPSYSEFTREQAIDRIKEEYLADLFQAYMIKNGDISAFEQFLQPIIQFAKDLFNKLRSWLGFVKGHQDQLNDIFSLIRKGDFVSEASSDKSGDVVFKALPFMTSADSSDLIRTLLVTILKNGKKTTDKAYIDNLLNEVMKDASVIPSIVPYREDVHKHLIDSRKAFVYKGKVVPVVLHPTQRHIVVKELEAYLKKFDIELEESDEIRDDEDIAQYRDIEFDKNPQQTTLFQNLPKEIRDFLIGIGIQEDENILVRPISVLGTYAQLKRILAGHNSFDDMMTTLEMYKSSSKEVGAIWEALQTKKEDLFFAAKFRVAFTMEYMDATHIDINAAGEELAVYAANRSSEEQELYNRWYNSYNSLVSRYNKEQIETLTTLANKALTQLTSDKKNGVTEINIEPLRSAMENLGINLSPSLIALAIKDQQMLDTDKPYPFYDAEGSSFRGDIKEILLQFKSGNPFVDAESRILNLAKADSKHRNDLYQTSYRNAENESVQSFVRPSYEYTRARKLREGDISLKGLDGNYIVDFFRESKETKGESFDDKINLSLSMTSGVREASQDEGVNAGTIDNKSNLFMIHALYSEGRIMPFVHESKKSRPVVNLTGTLATALPKTDGKSNGVEYEDFVDRKAVTETNKIPGLSQIGLRGYRYIVEKNIKNIEKVIGEINTPNFKLIEDYHVAVKGNKANAYTGEGWNKKIVKPDLTNFKEDKNGRLIIPNGLKLIQFPALQLDAEEIYKKQEEKDWMKAVQEASSDLDTFLQKQHQLMVTDYISHLGKRGISLDRNQFLLMGNRSAQYSGENGINEFISDFVAGQLILNYSYRELIVGDEASYLGQIDITKRAAGLVAAGASVGDGQTKIQILADTYKPYETGIEGIKGSDGVNYTDAQAHQLPSNYNKYNKELGKFDARTYELSERRANGELLSDNEIEELLTVDSNSPMKLVIFNGEFYGKMSVFTIWPDTIYNLNPKTNMYDKEGGIKKGFEGIAAQYESMKDSKTDMTIYESGVKKGRTDIHSSNEEGRFNLTEHTGVTINDEDIRLQTENPGGKIKITLGTQLQQLIDSEMEDIDAEGNLVMLDINGREMSLRDARLRAQSILAELTNDSFQKASTIFNTTIINEKGDKENLGQTILRNSASSNGASNVDLEWFKQDANGNLILSPNTPSRFRKNIEGFMAYFNKNVLQKKVAGLKLTLVSSNGFKNPQNGEDLKIHRFEDGKVKEGEALISEEILWQKGIRQETNQETGKFFLYKAGDLTKTPLDEVTTAKILSMLGFRIPTQSHHSMMPFKVVGFLPALHSSSIVVPGALAHLAGSDYDVDSLFVNRKEFYLNEQNQLVIYGEDPTLAYKEWRKTQAKDDIIKDVAKKYSNEKLETTISKGKEKLKETYDQKKQIDAAIRELDSEIKSTNNYKKRQELTDTRDQAYADLVGMNTKIEAIKAQINEFEDEFDDLALTYALSNLKMPTTPDSWKASGSPRSKYAASNELLDLYTGFMMNPRNLKSIFTPASMDSIAAVGKAVNKAYNINEESSFPYSYIGNMQSHWEANKSEIVGPAANGAKVNAWLSKNLVRLTTPFSIGSFTSTGYDRNEEYDIDLDNLDNKIKQSINKKEVVKKKGRPSKKDQAQVEEALNLISEIQTKGGKIGRKADSLSSLVSAMTDNAKERLAIKLNLTVDTIMPFANLLAMGFGMNRTMLFANQPVLRSLSSRLGEAKAHINKTESSWELSKRVLERLKSIIGSDNIEDTDIDFTDEDLVNHANINSLTMLEKFKGKSDEYLAKNGTQGQELTEEERKFFILQFKVLQKYVELQRLTEYFAAANRILNTNKGAGITGEDIDRLNEDVKKFDPFNEPPFALPNRQETESIAKNLQVVRRIEEDLVKNFITRNPVVTRLQEDLALYNNRVNNPKMRESLKSGYLYSLVVQGINKALSSVSDPNKPKSLADYSYLINETEGNVEEVKWNQMNIVDQYKHIDSKFNTPNSPLSRNKAWKVLQPRSPDDTNPFYRIEYNTNMKLDAQYKDELVEAMDELLNYGSHLQETHPIAEFAQNIYVSLALKDSLGYRNNSPISLFPPMKFLHIGKFLEGVKDRLDDRTAFREFAKISYYDFETQFLLKWLKDPNMRNGWKQVNIPSDSPYLIADGKKLKFNFNSMTKDAFDSAFLNSKSPVVIKTDKKTGIEYPLWPKVISSKDDTWVRSLNLTDIAEYIKVDSSNFNFKHSPYSIPVDFETTKTEKKTGEFAEGDRATGRTLADVIREEAEAEALAYQQRDQIQEKQESEKAKNKIPEPSLEDEQKAKEDEELCETGSVDFKGTKIRD